MIVGIDLGTTNSLVGVFDETPKLFRNPLGDFLTPSVVSVDDEDRIVIGRAARDRLVTHPGRSVAAFKRWMGTPRETLLGTHAFRPEELSALVLRALIADAEAATGRKVEEAVISVPAYFSDAQRKATRAAGELAGIRVERLINEPTAAALAYGLQERRAGSRFLVFDLGGGTFDVSILELFDGVVEVHASAGDNFLGGEDFLDMLVGACLDDLHIDRGSLEPGESAQLRHRIERAKCELSNSATAQVEFTVAGSPMRWLIDEGRFERLVEPLVQRLRTPLERAMRDSRLQSSQLDEIVLVGGASRMSLVARAVSRMFGRLPLRHVNPDQAIGLGAAIAAGLKARDAKLEEIILTDVCPYTLGTEVSRAGEGGQPVAGFFHPIIPRNSTVPVSREDSFTPVDSAQKRINFQVYQGESPLVARNIKLGELAVPIPLAKKGIDRSVVVRFTYDLNGILQVEVRVLATGERFELVLEQNPGLLTPEEIKHRLAELDRIKLHPRDQQENIALISRAERLYEEHLRLREYIQQWLLRFRSAINGQDARMIADCRREFASALDSMEGGGA